MSPRGPARRRRLCIPHFALSRDLGCRSKRERIIEAIEEEADQEVSTSLSVVIHHEPRNWTKLWIAGPELRLIRTGIPHRPGLA